MTNTLGRLHGRGFVRIRTHPNDRRSKLVSMSSKGDQARRRAIKALAPAFAEFETQFPMSMIQKMIPTLRSIRKVLDEMRS